MKTPLKILNFLEDLLDFFSSRKCLICLKKRSEPKHNFTCLDCKKSLEISFAESIKITKNEPKVIFFSSYYKKGTRKLIKKLKYRKARLALFWGNFLAEYWLKHQKQILKTDEIQELYITEIPMNSKREKQRGYNQSALIAKSFQASLKENSIKTIYLANLLKRVKNTEALYKKTKAERLEILKGAFKLNKDLEPKNKSKKLLILVDDITTTGTSLLEAYKELKQANTFQEIVLLACAGNH